MELYSNLPSVANLDELKSVHAALRLHAAITERNIFSPIGEKPEGQLRPLAKLEPAQQRKPGL